LSEFDASLVLDDTQVMSGKVAVLLAFAKRQRRLDSLIGIFECMVFGKENLLHAIIGALLALLILGFLYRMGLD